MKVIEDEQSQGDEDMKVLYNAALILRKAIGNAKKLTFEGSFTYTTDEHTPKELYSFYRWVVHCPNTMLSSDRKCAQINQSAKTLAQRTITMSLSQSQVSNRKAQTIRCTHEMPQQVAISLSVHKVTRSKKIINVLHDFGVSIEYNRLLRIESQIADAIPSRLRTNYNIFIPADFVCGRHLVFLQLIT